MQARSHGRISAGNANPSRFAPQTQSQKIQQPSYIKFTKNGPRHMKPQQTEYRIRDSIADLVMNELNNFDRYIFFQRVYILAKNIVQTVTAQSSAVSLLSKYLQSKSSVGDGGDGGEEMGEEEGIAEISELEGDGVSQTQLKNESGTDAQNAKNLLKLTKEDFDAAPKEKRMKEVDFFDQFKGHIETIVRNCETSQLSEDKFAGMLLCMGASHTLIVLEGAEDTVAQFCQELVLISDKYFESMRVFLVEDRIEETYFDKFLYRRSVAMNINEKFPPPTANDPQLMASQHFLIKERLRILCQKLSNELRPKEIVEKVQEPETIILAQEEEKTEPTKRRFRMKKRRKKAKKPVAAIETAVQDQPPPAVSDENADDKSSMDLDMSRQASLSEPRTELQEGQKLLEDTADTATELSHKSQDSSTRKSSIRIVERASVMSIVEPVPELKPEPAAEEEAASPKETLPPFTLNPSVYNRILPEIQRIELVLTSTRFYLSVHEFARFSLEIPMQNDEDALIWPTGYSYLPLNIFERMPFDVNLTFGNYDAKEGEGDDSDSSEEGEEKEEKAAEGEGAKGDNKQA